MAGPVRIVAGPTSGGQAIAVVAASLAGRDAAVADLRGELVVAVPLVLLAVAVGAYLVVGGALRPVERMRAHAEEIHAEDAHRRLPVPPTRDELARLGETLNAMLARLHTALDRERQFVADASHELRTPLSLLTTELELALHRPRGRAELEAALRSGLDDTRRLTALAQDLLLLARTERQPADPTALVATRLAPLLVSAAERARGDPRRVTVRCPTELTARADPDGLDRAVRNLLDNAVRHGRGPIDVHADAAPHNGGVAIRVRDHGPGFPAEFLPHAFARFSRANAARSGDGTGLGLAIAAALAHRMHGTITADNHPDGGAVVTITLPAG
jgi:signal transduction histidine kinase